MSTSTKTSSTPIPKPSVTPASSTTKRKDVVFTNKERLNQTQLKNVTDGEAEFESELLTLYKEDLESSIIKLEKALLTQNTKDSIHYSHDIKGSSGNIGADYIREIARTMEETCKLGRLDEAVLYLEQLKEEAKQIYSIIDSHLNK
eukprot:TRINITY_DN1624_c0_g1_i1.p1 TRINITY_DN1624_c0_g1~~TRINITY_DN1624_c0_g1_i1.p1  ORF type:complete len:146 (+),score=33.98 TRINITY_DN1624_c0_g1_i1:97-534(+)